MSVVGVIVVVVVHVLPGGFVALLARSRELKGRNSDKRLKETSTSVWNLLKTRSLDDDYDQHLILAASWPSSY
jgi:hypothetical protein